MSEFTFDNPCSPYVNNCDDDECTPCKCPVCGAFLPNNIYKDPLICKKCGSELVAVDASKEKKQSDDWDGNDGHICVVTRCKRTVEESREDRAAKRLAKKNAKTWKSWL